MACYHPLEAWYSQDVNTSGKRSLVFDSSKALFRNQPIKVACGQCVGCRLERSRQWAIRCIHEASQYEDNCFITLTFNDQSLFNRENPASLNVVEFQKFMKRLRKKLLPKNPYSKTNEAHLYQKFHKKHQIRYFHCGEYGEKYGRPHYHACLFNIDFKDKELFKIENGHRLYTSKILSKLWPFGHCSIGNVTFESAAYVARYIMKKVTGDPAEEHYRLVDEETGEYIDREPEYTTMSRRPGIGKDWFDQYQTDVYPSDFITVNGKKMRPPKFYDKLYEAQHPYKFEEIKQDRVLKAKDFKDNNTPDRLATREKVQLHKLDHLPRNLDKDD